MPADPTKDRGGSLPRTAGQPARGAAAVTPNDTTDLPTYARALFIGTAGNISVIPVNNDDAAPVTLKVAAGVLPVQVRRVRATGTTAADIVALYD